MLKKFAVLVPAVFLASSAFAWAPVELSNPKVVGGCNADLRIEEADDGSYIVVADFNDAVAAVEGSQQRSFKSCTYKYDIKLDPSYVLDRVDTTVQGYYSIAQGGKVTVGIENRAVGSQTTSSTRMSFNGPVELGNIDNFVGSIHAWQLPFTAQVPGGKVSMNSKFTLEAANSSISTGATDVRLTTSTDGVSSFPICHFYVRQK